MVKKICRKLISYFALCTMSVSMVLPLVSCGEDEGKEPTGTKKYEFVYDMNYEGGKNVTLLIAEGGRATKRTASRAGYLFDGWFCESECVVEYNFATPVYKDTTVYALWTDADSVVYYDVVFDYGNGFTKTVECREDKTIKASAILGSQKLGYAIEGWYLDQEYTQEFDVSSDVVTGEMTLYAKYVRMPGVEYTEDGDFEFDNVAITIGFQDSGSIRTSSGVLELIEDFNRAYEGQISVSINTNADDKSSGGSTIIFEQTEMINEKYSNYIPMQDALELVGKDFAEDSYYRNQINDCYVNDKLYSMPIGSYVPVAIYNKNLMNKYNPNGVLPDSYQSYTDFLKTVDAGERAAQGDAWQGAMTMSTSWDMKEIASNNFYIQNNIPLYQAVGGGKYRNQWLTDTDMFARAEAASTEFYNDWVQENAIGRITGETWKSGNKGVKWGYVGIGNSFMGVVGTPNVQSMFGWRFDNQPTGKLLFSKYVGVWPVSYLFASQGDNEWAERIFVKNFSLAIPNYSTNNVKEVAAAAVFADFMSKYCERISESYIYPANKVAQENMFNNVRRFWAVDYVFEHCGSPELFYTYPGGAYEYNVINSIHSRFLTNKLYWLTEETIGTRLSGELTTLANNINKEIGA